MGTVAGGQLTRSLAGITLFVNDTPAPLFYVSAQQINFQVPYEVSGRPSAGITISVDGTPARTVTLPVIASAPAIFPSQGDWAILNQDYALNNSDNPAPVGSAVIVYCTGLGVAGPQVPTGAVAPASPLSSVPGVTASVGDAPAQVYFAGLAPGFVGLEQVNVIIPAGTAAGYQSLVLTVGGESSQSWVMVNVK
jgi:uncharacterized protein (TIGR03437 family)